MLQAAAAKVKVVEAAGAPPPADTRPSPSSRLDTATVTAAEGRVSSATGNVAVPPASVACPAVSPTTRPTSSSRFTTDTLTTGSPS